MLQSSGEYEADVVVIGGGPGGYVAALRAAQLGGKAIVIERDNVGGTCLNWGCIPSKALLACANLIHHVKDAGRFGVNIENYSIDVTAMMKHKDQVVTQLRNGTEYLLKRLNVELIKDTGRLLPGNVVQVGDRRIKARNVILAMGSVVARPPIPGLGDNYITSNEALSLDPLPKSICIIGAGAVGLEMGYFWNACGVEVTTVEMTDKIGSNIDVDVASELKRALEKQGMRFYMNAPAKEVRDAEGGREVVCGGAKGDIVVKAETILLATSRWPATQDQGLEELGLEMERGFVKVNSKMETNLPGVYAIGDIAGHPMLAHKAHHEGFIAAENVMGGDHHMSYRAIPGPIYTEPEVASVGLTEPEARERGYEIQVGTFPNRILGKSLAMGNRSGFAKVISDRKYGEILGVHIIGPNATELIAEAVVAMESEATVEELAHSIHPHPSLSEGVMEAALDILGASVHKP
ncbi:MAG: dihydrolipoyl dehydrogenase [Armatimonadetes bacterium]|nr:dihydrolipoyl dehydrogenase [Armatimonadota bacterium]